VGVLPFFFAWDESASYGIVQGFAVTEKKTFRGPGLKFTCWRVYAELEIQHERFEFFVCYSCG